MAVIKVFTDDLMSVQNAAKELGRPRLAIYRMIERGTIISIKLGGTLFIPTSEVERLKRELDKKGGELSRKRE